MFSITGPVRHRKKLPIGLLSGLVAALVCLAAQAAEEPAESFDYFRNSWNVVGLKDYQYGARITPDNAILLADGGKVRFWFGTQQEPLSRKHLKRCLEGWLPVMVVQAQEGQVRYEFCYWATPLPTVKDWKSAFYWPTEGENFLIWVRVTARNQGGQLADAKLRVRIERPKLSQPKADTQKNPPQETELQSTDSEIEEQFSWALSAGASQTAVVRVPYFPEPNPERFAKEDPQLWLDRTVRFWKGLLDNEQVARIQVPCRKASEALLAAHVCQMLVSDHGRLHAGEGFYDEFYIRDGAYQIMELEEAGLWDPAGKAIEFYLKAQRPDGRFETQTDQLDANGQAVWALWQYWKITGNKSFLERAYPAMVRAMEWTKKARRQAPADSPFAGVLPPAPADGEYLWDGKHHIVGYDFWNLRAMELVSDAAWALGQAEEAKHWAEEAAQYRQAIEAAWKRTGLPYFPPSWEKQGTHWGNTETLWPVPIWPIDDPRVAALIRHVRQEHGGGYCEGTIRWLGTAGAIHPYLSAYTTMADLIRADHEQVVEDFYWYLLHSTTSHAFPEGIYYRRGFAWNDTIPHPTGAANYALMLRHMLVHEQAGELHLLRAVPDWWLGPGQKIVVQRAPTHFGLLSMIVEGTAEGLKVSLQPPDREKPRKMLLFLPKNRRLLHPVADCDVVYRSPQKIRWDFPTVVRKYEQLRLTTKQAIAGLVALPIVQPVPPEKCIFLDLSKVANTDPFTAPFGVPNPGEDFLMKGLPVGRTIAGGVPFEIIDPAKNDGRALVVLHSARAPKPERFPKEVEILVNCQGRRLFLLGNVHGWDPQDAGVEPSGAVAEYIICYADGQRQTIPLITGQTIDDWAQPPDTTDLQPVLRGRRWHLNLLGVQLRPVKVEKLIFRDLGTPAAPLLAAATIEQP
ncbi:MAG: hypothetical protein RMI90_01105 [Thermoguttaceae bacterium]|nr:hypothetical protein [Thermoguttaceae bacterium]